MKQGAIIHILAIALLTVLTFSSHSLYGMQALRDKQAKVAKKPLKADIESLHPKSEAEAEEQLKRALQESAQLEKERIEREKFRTSKGENQDRLRQEHQEAIQRQIEEDAKLARFIERLQTPTYKAESTAAVELKPLILPENDQQKDGVTCGPRSMYLADAVERLLRVKREYELKVPITPETMSQALQHTAFATQMEQCKSLGQLFNEDFHNFLLDHHIALPHLFLLGFFEGENVEPIPQRLPNENDLEELTSIRENLKILGTKLKNNHLPSPIHFICNTGGHWVLFSVTHYQGHVVIWYIDPMQSRLSAHLQKFVNYICTHLGLNPIPKI